MTIRVGIAAFAADGGRSGIGQYIVNVVPRLQQVAPDLEPVVFVPRGDADLLASMVPAQALIEVPDWMAHPVTSMIWHLLLFPLLLRRYACNCAWLPAGNRRLGWYYGVPSVGTVHDLSQLHIEGKYDALRMFYVKRILPPMMRRLTRVVAVSHSTRRDLESFAGVASERIRVAHNGADLSRFRRRDHRTARDRSMKSFGIDSAYILYTARLEHPGKNHVRLLQALAAIKHRGQLRHQLVLAGSPWNGAEAITDEIERLELKDDVVITGFVANEDLPDLYAGADLFVFPSLFEGFGIPVLEAMASQTPVCAADVASIPEVTGDAALLFDPSDPDDIAQSMERLLNDPTKRRQLRQRGLQQAGHFSWEQSAQGVVEQCRKAVAA